MTRITRTLTLACLILVTLALPAAAQELSGQQKLMARRAAELDAYRKMAESIKGLNISSRTTVNDFITQSDDIEASFEHFIKGLQIIGTPIFHPDGTAEVTVGVTIERVVQELRQMRQRHYNGNSYHDHTFNKLVNVTQQKTLTATGFGAPNDMAGNGGGARVGEARYPDEVVEAREFPNNPSWQFVTAPTEGMPGWYGVTGQGRLMALRAAEVDAMRKLTETIQGVHLTSSTKVQDFVAASDEIKADLEAFTKGIGTVGAPRYQPDGTVEVDMAVTVAQVVEEIKRIKARRQVGPRIEEKEIIKQREYTRERVVQVTGHGVPPANTVLHGVGFVGWQSVNPRMKLMARRTAETVAYRRLAERIHGLRLTSNTTVSDFVTESDMMEVASQAVLKGMSQEGNTYFFDDGSIQLTMRVPFEVVVKEVYRVIHKGHGPQPPPQETVKAFQTTKWIAENGYGAVPGRAPYFGPSSQPAQPTAGPGTPPWAVSEEVVTGSGVPPADAETPQQGRLLAERAAEADAYRKLYEMVGGVKIDSSTTVVDFVTGNDTIRTEIDGILQGAKKVAVRVLPDGVVEVDMVIDMGLIWKAIRKHT